MAADLRIRIMAAAPSFKPAALPAVTVPFDLKAGRKAASLAAEVFARTASSCVIFWPATATGVISASKRCAAWALTAFYCDFKANASCSARLIWNLLATFSAVIPMGSPLKASVRPSWAKLSVKVTSPNLCPERV